MKIVLVSYLHGMGGAEAQIIKLANELYEQGNAVLLYVLNENNCTYQVQRGIQICDMSHVEKNSRVSVIKRFVEYKKNITKDKPDVVIHFWLQSALFATLLNRKERQVNIYSERNDPGGAEYSVIHRILRKILFHRIDGFVFQSQGAKKYFPKYVQRKGIVIHNPVRIEEGLRYCPRGEYEKSIVTVGRLHPQKNQKLLIEAFKRISGDYPDVILDIYGDGYLEYDLKTLVNEYMLNDSVRFHSSTPNIHEIMSESLLFVLTSDYEGLPNVLLEAMAIGMPCISTDCKPGGARELLVDGENGYIIPIGNAVMLEKRIRALLDDPRERMRMGLNAQIIRETHAPSRIYKKWSEYINTVVKERKH